MNRLSSLASSDSSLSRPFPELHLEELGGASAIKPSELSSRTSLSPLGNLLRPRVERPRSFMVPVRYEPGYRYPLIVWLHNDGYNENQIRDVLPHISTRNFVGVGVRGSLAIDSVGNRFAWSQTPAAVARCEDAVWQAVDDACERYSIHRERIFLAGYGEGGTMARRVAFRRSSHFAGCIALGGRLPRGGNVFGNLNAARELKNFWALAIHGQAMSEEQFDEDIRLAADAKLRMDVRRYTTDDEMVTEVLRDVNVWAMEIVTGQKATDSHSAAQDWATTPVQFSSN
jgi:phospholipase/carboxylesterase